MFNNEVKRNQLIVENEKIKKKLVHQCFNFFETNSVQLIPQTSHNCFLFDYKSITLK